MKPPIKLSCGCTLHWDRTIKRYFVRHCALHKAAPDLLAALEPFSHLVRVMDVGQILNFRGVYISYEQAKAAAEAITKAKGE